MLRLLYVVYVLCTFATCCVLFMCCGVCMSSVLTAFTVLRVLLALCDVFV